MLGKDRTHRSHDLESDETALPLLTLDAASRSRFDLPSELDNNDVSSRFTPKSTTHYEQRKSRYRERVDTAAPTYAKRTPLPLMQLCVLCAMRLGEPIAYTQIFPYINQMMEDLKVTDKPSEIGYYSGIVDSIFAVCQFFTILQWGRLSDRIGRKPVILIGLTGIALSSSLFGLSKSLTWAVISRSLAGALSGNVAVVQSVIGEITDETNQGAAFPLAGLSWSLGCIIGPTIGGNFVKPAESFPNTFGTIPIFRKYPYLLPCIVSAGMTLCSIMIGAIFLKESLPSKVALEKSLPSPISRRHSEKTRSVSSLSSNSSSSSSSSNNPNAREEMSVREILAAPAIKSIFKNYFILSVLGTAFDVVFILMAYTPVRLGGLSRKPEEIGYALAFSGVAGAIVQVLVFPVLQRRYDDLYLYQRLMMLWPVLFAFLPFVNLAARWAMPVDVANIGVALGEGVAGAVNSTVAGASEALGDVMGDANSEWFPAGPVVWTAIGISLALLRVAHMSFSLNIILIKNAAPSKETLGATFGLSQSVACIARATSPAFVSSLFAISKKYQILGGNFVWVIMFGIGLLGLWSTFQVRRGSVEREHVYGGGEESEMRML